MEKRIAPYFDIPFQHSSNEVLKAMHRRGTKEDYVKLINKIREKVPNAILRTTYIVGFPGESDADFEDLLDFTRISRFDHMGAFKYSREENTLSYSYPHQIDEKLKASRLKKLMETQKSISYQNNKSHIGEIMEGIVINYNPTNKLYEMRSYWNAPDDIDGKITFSSDKKLAIGEVVKIKITNAFVYDLYGEFIK